MAVDTHPSDVNTSAEPSGDNQPPHPDTFLIAFLENRSAPCPRCAYDLRNIKTPKCPECGEPLILKVGTPHARFGWLLLAMAPGCFSGVAAGFVLVPITGSALVNNVLPWPIVAADVFGFLSAASVLLMYRYRHRIMSRAPRRQAFFAAAVWAVHILAFGLFVLGMILFV